MKKGFFGQYTYISMTKVDVYEHGNLDIKATAVHEYVHSHLVRATLYGQFMRSAGNANLIDSRYKKIFEMLYENEEKVQETTATLIELIYVWYKKGLKEALSNLNKLTYPYNNFLRNYRHLFNSDYLMGVYKQYLDFIEKELDYNSEDEKFCKELQRFIEEMKDNTEEKSALNMMFYLILKVAEFSLTIDMEEIDGSLWKSESKFKKYIRNQNSKMYYPNTRFKDYMKYVLPDRETTLDRFYLDGIVKFPANYQNSYLYNVDNYILERYDEGTNVDKKLIKNKISEYINIQVPEFNNIKKIETEAIIYAQPYPLNVESAEKLFGNDFWVDNGLMEIENFKSILEVAKTIHIHPSTGIESPCRYDVQVSSTFNPDNVKHPKNQVLQAGIEIDYLEELLTLIEDYKGIIYITGCHRSKELISELKNKNNKIFINSVASLTSSIEFINAHFPEHNAEIIKTRYCDVLLMKNSQFVFIQYLLPQSRDVISRLIAEQVIHLSKLKETEKSTILDRIDWENVELFTEEYYKSCCTYMAKKGW